VAALPVGEGNTGCIGLADGGTGGINLDGLAGLGIVERDYSGTGQLFIDRIAHAEGDDVVAACRGAKLAGLDGGQEIGDEEDGSPALMHTGEVFECSTDIGARGFGVRPEHFTDDAEHVRGAAGRAEVAFGPAGKEEEANAVLVADGGEGKDGADLGGEIGLGAGKGAGTLGGADIDGEDDGEVAVFAVATDGGLAGAGVGLPIDRADIIAGNVGAELIEFDAASAEDGMVLTEEEAVDETAGADFDGADAIEQLGGMPPGEDGGRAGDGCAGRRATSLMVVAPGG